MEDKLKPYRCPVCNAGKQDILYPQHEGKGVSSDFKVIDSTKLDNRICQECGLIFNAAGVRGHSEAFYMDTYNLMQFDNEAEVMSFSERGPVSQAENSYNLFLELVAPDTKGRLLEVGAGKGHFLKLCSEDLPEWEITALEPSDAFHYLRENVPKIEAYRTHYAAHRPEINSCDVIVALGVLEHVENPLDMMQWVDRTLRPGGHFFLRVPNFENNPNDLFCVDHLSKLTEPTLKWLAECTGCDLLHVRRVGVPLFALLRKRAGPFREPTNAYEVNKRMCQANSEYAKKAIETIVRARGEARERKEKLAIFGLAISGLFAPLFAGFEPAEITAYIDENTTMWNAHVHGRPVGGLDFIIEKDIRHIAVTISPAYIDKVKAKLREYPVSVYTPDLSEMDLARNDCTHI
jgi:SAM-dependent methyltransferase